MKKALIENRWLATVAIVLLTAALIMTLFPALQAGAQGCGKSGYMCGYRRYYTCVWRDGRQVCGWFWFCYCVPNYYRRWW